MITLNYGEMPARADFRGAFEAECPDGRYAITLNSSDRVNARRCGLDGNDDGELYLEDTHSEGTLWRVVSALQYEWDLCGEEWAGDFASSILYTLGIEWV
jgi:hypothetical protein